MNEVPDCFFSRAYRGKNFVCYNLKYDSGALLQTLPSENLRELRETDRTVWKGFRYKVIGYKCMVISKGRNAVTFYDMLGFYEMSLEAAAEKYLGEHKLFINTKRFDRAYIADNISAIKEYCIQDAVLVKRLAEVLIKMFEQFGVYPKKLYSVAYISYQYFRSHTPYVTVKRYWEKYPEVLDFALQAYNGGKFEVTTKGSGYYYQYDIVSAYPWEIRNLADITYARIEHGRRYRREALYGFLKCTVNIPYSLYSPVVVKRGSLNCFPCGAFTRIITKEEYEYLVAHGADCIIKDAYWFMVTERDYPYRAEIDRLVILKQQYKLQRKDLEYHTVKILLNSLYGKFLQLIDRKGLLQAGASWNPIYGAIITANCRIRMSEMQNRFKEVIAVHTDSLISTAALPIVGTGKIGEYGFECEGDGLVLGSGIYQIGHKVRFRGFDAHIRLIDLVRRGGEKITIKQERPLTWRTVAVRHLNTDRINRFEEVPRELDVRFDRKRLWIDDWKDFSECMERNVSSFPLFFSPLFFR